MTEPAPTVVVFDLGGVLIAWDPRRVFRRCLPDDSAVERFLETVGFAAWNAEQDAGRPWADGVRQLSARHPDYAEVIAAYPQRFAESLVGEVPGTVAVLAELHAAGVRLLALTNWSAESFVHARARFPFLDLFEAILVSGEERIAKPDPALFRLLLDRHELVAEEVLFVDDSPANVAAARTIGLRSVHFRDAERLRADLVAAGLLEVGAGADAAPTRG